MTTYTLKVIHAAFEDDSRHVATVTVEANDVHGALETAFRLTNNIEGSWSRPATFEFDGQVHENLDYDERVTVEVPDADFPRHRQTGDIMGLRSTSMDDRIHVQAEGDDSWVIYEVDIIGFKVA